MDWQPIETAPKDGTHILAYQHTNDPDDEHVIYVVLYRKVLGEWEWIEARGEEYACFEPTHWMPLPNPPAIGEKE